MSQIQALTGQGENTRLPRSVYVMYIYELGSNNNNNGSESATACVRHSVWFGFVEEVMSVSNSVR